MDSLIHQNIGLDAVNDVLSRQVKINHTAPTPTILNCLQNNQLTEWSLTVTETGLTTDAQLTITISQANTSYQFKQPLNRGGSWTMQGWGSCRVDAEAIHAGTVRLDLSLTPSTFVVPYVMVAGSATFQSLPLAGVFYPVESLANLTPSGYSPPFCTFVSLKPTFNTAIRFVDNTGTTVYQTAILTNIDEYWKEIRLFPWLKIEVAPQNNGQGLSALWHN